MKLQMRLIVAAYYKMQLHSANRQNLSLQGSDSHEQESLQCQESLSLPLAYHCENRVKSCGCRCSCEEPFDSALEKRRQKRKQSKRRQKQRLKQLREKALLSLQTIIRSVYGLECTFKERQSQIQQCLSVETNRDRLWEFINTVIRDQIDLIRREIVQAIASMDQLPEGDEQRAVAPVFHPIRRIALASPQIERLINLFVASYSEGEQEEPLQRNLDRTTLKFLVKTDLYRTGNFNRLCSHIFQAPPQLYLQERELINLMMASFDSHTHQLHSEHSEDDSDHYIDDDDEWEEDGSTLESPKGSANERSRRRRKERKRKLREDFESSFEAIVKRTEDITVQDERNQCYVSEEWLERIRRRRKLYSVGK